MTPLPVPATGDIQISAQGSCMAGYPAMMEKLKVLLGMLDAHKHMLIWLYAVMQVFMP